MGKLLASAPTEAAIGLLFRGASPAFKHAARNHQLHNYRDTTTYAGLPESKDKSILQAGWNDGWTVHQAITYNKGALVLAALEQRIGKEAVLDVAKSFLASRKGKTSTWMDFVSTLNDKCGTDCAEWFRGWLSRPGAPDIKLANVVVDGRELRADLVQTVKPSFTGDVELVFFAKDRRLSSEVVKFKGPATSLRLAIPAGAIRVEIDPNHRMPRRYDAKAKAVDIGLALELGTAAR